MKNNTLSGVAAIAFAAIMWGFDGVVLTPRLYNLNPTFVVFMLHALPFALMHLFFLNQYKLLSGFKQKDFLVFSLIAATGGSLGTLSIVKALFLVNFQHLSVVVLLQKLQPVFAIILAAILLKEKMTQKFALWASIAIIAGYTLTFGFHLPHMHENQNTTLAALYALLAALFFGSSTVFSKIALQNYSFKTVTFYRYGFTTIIMLIIVVLSKSYTALSLVTTQNWLFFILIGLTTGSGAIFLYYYGLNRVKAIVSIIIELLFPMSAIVFDYLINHSVLSGVQWISAVLLIFAIVKLTLNK